MKTLFLSSCLLLSVLTSWAQCPNNDIILDSQRVIDQALKSYPNCSSFDHNIRISGRDIVNLNGLANLIFIKGNLTIDNNDVLTSIAGLTSLTKIGGNFSIEKNRALTNLDGIQSLTIIDGNFSVVNNSDITSLEGPASLTVVLGNVDISSNNLLTNLDGLSNLAYVSGNFYLNNNNALTDLDGLARLASVDLLEIINDSALTNLDGLNKLTSVGRDLNIKNNSALTNLDGLNKLTSVGGYLEIINNSALMNLDGLNKLTSVGRYLEISNNSALTNLEGLSKVTSVGSLFISKNSVLTNLDGLSKVTSMVELDIQDNDALTNLDGLSKLTSIRNLFIQGNDALTNLDGLSKVISIENSCSINSNLMLTNLNGLSNLTPNIIGDLIISNNPRLSTCANDGICGLLDIRGQIVNNAPGCNSHEEVRDACQKLALPVTLISFTAVKEDAMANLSWSTAAETHSSHFEVEHSLTARSWQTLGTVAALGESSTVHRYTFADNNPANGENFYRLRMSDQDGSFSYSKIQNLRFDLPLAIYPNPVADRLQMQEWSTIQHVRILSPAGQLVLESDKVQAQGMDVEHLPAGLYHVQLTRADRVQTYKIIKN